MPRQNPPRRPLPAPALLRLLVAVVLLSGLAANPPARAERADRYKPTQVESDRMEYDDLKQVNVFTGSVVLTRGTITIKGDRMVVSQDAEGYQHGTTTGKLASFRQKRDGLDEWLEGYGEEIEYNGKTETVRLIRKAKVRRLDGTRVIDEIEGPLIIYDGRTEQFNVEGAAIGPAASGRERVKVVIQPRLTDPTPGAQSSPAAPKPGAVLQPSPAGGSR
jgi:lipopolysaccharide export system protein LptA